MVLLLLKWDFEKLKYFSKFEKIDAKYHDIFSICWFKTNLPRFCALVIIFRRCVDNTNYACSNTTLLTHPQGLDGWLFSVSLSDEVNALEGCYLHYHTTSRHWIWAGIALRADISICSMASMQLINVNSSKAKEHGSRFELLHPTWEFEYKNTICQGWFLELQRHCVVGFDQAVAWIYV